MHACVMCEKMTPFTVKTPFHTPISPNHVPVRLPLANQIRSPHLPVITQILRSQARISLRGFRHLRMQTKSDGSTVTQVDLAINAMAIKRLRAACPHHGIISEEDQPINPQARWQWVLDPLDGTASFSCGYPAWGIGLGLWLGSVPMEGYLHFPAVHETYAANSKEGCFYNAQPMKAPIMQALPDLQTCLVDSTLHRQLPLQNLTWLKLRIFGSNLYHMMCVAMGRATAMVSSRVFLWDMAAALPFTRNLGLVECHLDGSPLNLEALLRPPQRLPSPLVMGFPAEVQRIVDALNP